MESVHFIEYAGAYAPAYYMEYTLSMYLKCFLLWSDKCTLSMYLDCVLLWSDDGCFTAQTYLLEVNYYSFVILLIIHVVFLDGNKYHCILILCFRAS